MNRPDSIPAAAVPAARNAAPAAATGLNGAGEGKRSVDFLHLWHVLVERIWILVLCVLAGLFLALGYLARTPKLYTGHIVLEVEMQEPTVVTGDESIRLRSAFLASQEALRTIEQNLVNRSLLARVIRAEGLAEDEGRALLGEKRPKKATSSATAPLKTSSAPGVSRTEREPAFTSTEEALGGALSTMVKPVIRRGTRLIDVYVTNSDPVLAQRLAEAVGREYIRNAIELRASFSQDALRYLLEEEERLKVNLQKSEAAVTEYKAKTPDALQLGGGAAATGSQTGAGSAGGRGGLVEDKLQELSSKLSAAKADRLRLEGELSQVEQAGDNLDAVLAVPSIASSANVNERRRELAQVEATVAALSQRYKDKHPKMMAAHAALKEAQNALRREALAQPAVLRNAVEQARSVEKSLEGGTREQEKAALALNKAAIGYQELARQAETDRALYETVLRQIKETDLTKGVKANAASVVEHSSLPRVPSSPNPLKDIALGLLGGIAAGLGIIFGANSLDRSIKTVDEAEALLGLPVLAAIPEVKSDQAAPHRRRDAGLSRSASYRLVAEAPEGPAAEAFRNLRAALSLLGPESERRVFLFASALPNEGKSFTSANYSLSLAQQGYRVLLMDGDLRRPSLHKIFQPISSAQVDEGNGAEGPGIVDCLVGSATLSKAIRRFSASEVDIVGGRFGEAASAATATAGELNVLSGGLRAPNPAELLSGAAFGELVAEAARTFDRVIIDSAPVLAVSDTLLMVSFVQSVSVVVRASHTARNAVHRALSMLSGAGAPPVGIVLNRLPRHRGAGHYYYYASPGYGAGEGSYSGGYTGAQQPRT